MLELHVAFSVFSFAVTLTASIIEQDFMKLQGTAASFACAHGLFRVVMSIVGLPKPEPDEQRETPNGELCGAHVKENPDQVVYVRRLVFVLTTRVCDLRKQCHKTVLRGVNVGLPEFFDDLEFFRGIFV